MHSHPPCLKAVCPSSELINKKSGGKLLLLVLKVKKTKSNKNITNGTDNNTQRDDTRLSNSGCCQDVVVREENFNTMFDPLSLQIDLSVVNDVKM